MHFLGGGVMVVSVFDRVERSVIARKTSIDRAVQHDAVVMGEIGLFKSFNMFYHC